MNFLHVSVSVLVLVSVLKVLVKLRVSAALQLVNDAISLLSPCRYIYHEYCRPNEDPHGWGQAVRFDHWKAVRYASVINRVCW